MRGNKEEDEGGFLCCDFTPPAPISAVQCQVTS